MNSASRLSTDMLLETWLLFLQSDSALEFALVAVLVDDHRDHDDQAFDDVLDVGVDLSLIHI